MTEPQVWTFMGLFATAMFGALGLSSTLIIRVIKAEVSGINAQFGAINSQFAAVNGRFEAINSRFDAVTERLDGINHRLDGLDADVQAIATRVFGQPE